MKKLFSVLISLLLLVIVIGTLGCGESKLPQSQTPATYGTTYIVRNLTIDSGLLRTMCQC